jgi:ribonuclease G
MSKEIYISSTPHETRLAIVEKDELTEIYYERENEYTLAGSIYNGRVTRVLPGMQSSFVDIGLERDAFLYITDFMEEAGDSADFESTNTSAVPRSGNGERRGGERDRGRGRRDERPRPAQLEPLAIFPATDGQAFSAAPTAESDEVGEGAPGADGSRRWRGRRGRRRGRGQGDTPAEAPAVNDAIGDLIAIPETPQQEALPTIEESRERTEPGGGKERRRGRFDAIRERFTPRALRSNREEQATVDLQATEPAVEPLILPGESLSKYRRGEETASGTQQQAASVSANVIIPKPSTEVVPLLGWDGGAILPGETLSRHRGNERTSDESGRDRGNDRRRDRDDRHGRNDRNDQPQPSRQEFKPAATLDPAEAVLPAVTSQHDTDSVEVPLGISHHEDVAPNQAMVDPVEEFHAEEFKPEELQETVTEYEPDGDASASYRVDPSGPSEFRQSSVVEEPVAEEIQPAHLPHFDVTQTPLEHTLPVVEHQAANHEQTPTFAPGDGQLEEEILDDDEGEIAHLHASAFDDDTEEEILDNAADLGSMIRDMSIDEITRPEPSNLDEDEDDFEDEEDFEEDELASTGEEGEFEDDEISGSEISETEENEFAEAGEFENSEVTAPQTERAPREGGRRGRRDGRRGGRDRDRSSSSNGDRSSERPAERSGERSDSTGDRGSRDRRGMAGSRSGDRRGRPSVQATDLPAISDLLKPGQEVLVQIAKEPIAKKGARITSHIALPGRFLVFMPTVSHVGVSRKIESDGERRRLKEILLSERGEATGGFIVRTAASGASEEELRSDLRFLLNLWADIKQRSESSKSPALIYHDLNLIERILRDQVTDNFSAIWVDTEAEYERVLRFLQRFQPNLIRRVKLYGKDTPLFEQFGINAEIDKALRSKVWLKSGGSIVINQTEALVAIDINTGKYVGKTTKLEDTIVKTNLDAIPEIVRQIRLRDLGGIIIIDFIDMDERKNRNRVMAALEEELKSDRAPSKVLQFNDFGLVAITRKRVKQSLERTLSTTCSICQGTGMTKSPVTVCNDIYIEMRKMHKVIDKGDIMLRVHPEVVKQLKSNGGKWLQEMEELSRKTILVKSDPSLHPEQFDIH